MEKGIIKKLNKPLTEEEKLAEAFFIQDAEDNTLMHIKAYQRHPSSCNGRYICSDLFKETYPLYSESNASREKYNIVIHNSAAVLANEMFGIDVKDPSIKRCIFLTGIPGGGKSFFTQSLYTYDIIGEDTMVYEGSIISPSVHEKIQSAMQMGKEIYIIIVNPSLELAERNVISRLSEIGRDATCDVMAKIASEIPRAIAQIHEAYPDISLAIINKTSNTDLDCKIGFDDLDCLYRGSFNEILARLQALRAQYLAEASTLSPGEVAEDMPKGELDEDYNQKR